MEKQQCHQIAKDLGVDHKTVADAREKLERTWEIPKLDKTVGRDGKERTTTPARPVQETARAAAESVAEGNLAGDSRSAR